MHEVFRDIWEYLGTGAAIVITTSGSVSRSGRAVMGRGVARQAAERFPQLPDELGHRLLEGGNHVYPLDNGIVSFPVEESAWSCPDLRLIGRSAAELRSLADREGWRSVVVPRPGCGGGGLEWKEVRPLLEPHFDERFTIVAGTAG